jgi:hypothetical protein
VEERARAGEYHALESDFAQAYERRRAAALAMAHADGPAREEARAQFRAASGEMSSIRVQAAALVQDVDQRRELLGHDG